MGRNKIGVIVKTMKRIDPKWIRMRKARNNIPKSKGPVLFPRTLNQVFACLRFEP